MAGDCPLSTSIINLIRGVVGAQNVGLVYARWGALNHAPFRVLAYMALRSLDSGNPPIFYGGRDEVAIALGRPIPDAGPEFEKTRQANFNMVKKITRELSAVGAIVLVQAPGTGQNAVYELNLKGIEKALPREAGGTPGTPHGGTSGIRLVVPEVSTAGTSGTPLGVQGVVGVLERIDGEGDQQAAGFAGAREAAKANGFISTNSIPQTAPSCLRCSTLLDRDGSCFVCRITPNGGRK